MELQNDPGRLWTQSTGNPIYKISTLRIASNINLTKIFTTRYVKYCVPNSFKMIKIEDNFWDLALNKEVLDMTFKTYPQKEKKNW